MTPTQPDEAAARLRVLVITHALGGSTRFIGPVIEELLARGHEVRLDLEPPRWKHEHDPWLLALAGRSGFSWGIVDAWRKDPWFVVARWLRRSDDYLRAVLVGRGRIPYLVERARRRAPRSTQVVFGPLERFPQLVRRSSAVLTLLDRALPASRRTLDYLHARRPDVVVVVPVLMPGATDSAYVRACRAARIPSILCIPSWDNLSSKQRIRVAPDATTVWNITQQREAVDLHGLPEERVVVTGAQCFDHWFGWEARPVEQFAARSGIDPARPYLLYVGGAIFPSEITEAQFARRWVEDLRANGDERVRDVQVLIRPHPKRIAEWERVTFSDLRDVHVWPTRGRMPVEHEARADYYDSLFHSVAVVGINSSAMIESAIVGRPVFTILTPEFHTSQLGTLHFEYVLDIGGGFVRTARSLAEHRSQLEQLLADGSADTVRDLTRFVSTFVRPHGLDRPATPIFADALERVARSEALPEPPVPSAASGLRALLLPFLFGAFSRRVWLKLRLEGGRVLAAGARGGR